MAITTSNAISQGNIQRFDARHFDDAASPAAFVFYPGFRPKEVLVINLTDRITYQWYHGMTQGDYVKTVAAGTRTLETDDVLVVEVDIADGRPSITLVAAAVLQNKQYQILARA